MCWSSYLIEAPCRPTGIQNVTTPAEAHRSSLPRLRPSHELSNHHRRRITPRRCAAAPANDRMASQADQGEDPWNDKTKEKFNRWVLSPHFPLPPALLPLCLARSAHSSKANVLPSSSCSKSKSKWLDPCQEAASKSIKCLNRNGGDKAMCQDYFECVFPSTSRQAGWSIWCGIGGRTWC